MREVVITEDGGVIARFVQVNNPATQGPALVWKDTGEGPEAKVPGEQTKDELYDTEELIDQLVAVLL